MYEAPEVNATANEMSSRNGQTIVLGAENTCGQNNKGHMTSPSAKVNNRVVKLDMGGEEGGQQLVASTDPNPPMIQHEQCSAM